MKDYVVSARKYRPSTFKSVVGQEHITKTLQNAIRSNQLAQAFLFCGPRGVGKTTCARILAKTINCQNLTEDIEACNECESCKAFNNNASFNVVELDAASNNSVDDIRALVEQVHVPPQGQKYKVYIIDEVHMLSPAAFNAFLKTLEEPPVWAKFILATTEKNKILPTILSRCQIFDFRRINISDIATHLKYIADTEGIAYEPEALDIIAQKADGGLRDALSMFDQLVSFTSAQLTYQNILDNLNILDYNYYFKFVDALLECNIQKTLLLFNEVLDKGFEGNNFMEGLSAHLRSLLVGKDKSTISLLDVSEGIKEQYIAQSQKTPMLFLLRALDFANTCQIEYRSSANRRLCVELALLKMANIMHKLTPKTPKDKEAQSSATTDEKEDKAHPSYLPEETTIVEPVKPTPPQQEIKSKKLDLSLPKKPSISINTSIDETLAAAELIKQKENPQSVDLDWKLFEQKIQEYAQNISKYSPDLCFLLSTAQMRPKDNDIAVIELQNTAQEQQFLDASQYIVKYIRTNTGCKSFHFQPHLATQGDKPPLETLQEKFSFVSSLHPALTKLRENFDCRIDY